MKKTVITVLLAAVSASLTASQSLAPQEEMCPDHVSGLVEAAKKSIRLADMSSFREHLKKGDYDLIADVREPSDYAAGHIPGAINIPRGLIEFMIWPKLGFPDKTELETKGAKIYLYCNTGGRASLSGKALKELGFTKVTVVDMTVASWLEAGFSLEEGS